MNQLIIVCILLWPCVIFYTLQATPQLVTSYLRFNSTISLCFQTGAVILRMQNAAWLIEHFGVFSFLCMRGKFYSLLFAKHDKADQIHVNVYLAAMNFVAICQASMKWGVSWLELCSIEKIHLCLAHQISIYNLSVFIRLFPCQT